MSEPMQDMSFYITYNMDPRNQLMVMRAPAELAVTLVW